MKEQLRLFWEKESGTAARAFLKTWCGDALRSGIKALAEVGKTLAAYRTGLLNYFKHPITSAMVEGPQTAGLRIQGSRIFQAQVVPSPHPEVLIIRMNLNKEIRWVCNSRLECDDCSGSDGIGIFLRLS